MQKRIAVNLAKKTTVIGQPVNTKTSGFWFYWKLNSFEPTMLEWFQKPKPKYCINTSRYKTPINGIIPPD